MEKILSVIIIVVVSFYLLGLLGRLMLRWFIARQRRKFEQTGGGFRGFTWGPGGFQNWGSDGGAGANPREQTKKEGEVRIEQKVRTEKKVSGQVGEYVDYEEVDGDKK